MDIRIPKALMEGHHELGANLEEASMEGGKVGREASSLITALKPHEMREEQFALPPLGLLPSLINGELDYDMAAVKLMIDTFRAELPNMQAEHKEILAATDRLAVAAIEEGKAQYVRLAEALKLHVAEEEAVYYPAAILVGMYLEARLGYIFGARYP
jgi:hypothetical protein